MNKDKNLKYLPIVSVNKIVKPANSNKKSSKLITIFIIILILLLLLSSYSMAKAIEQVIIKSNTQIAEPILIIENNPSIDITSNNSYGTYVFKIKNYNDQNKITDTDLQYYIEILPNIDKSINIELYENNNIIGLENNKTQYMKIPKNQKQEKEYKIKISYNKENTNSINDILEKIQVKVHTEQIKG